MRRTRCTIPHGPARPGTALAIVLLASLAAGVAGCSGEASSDARVTIDTVAGVVHVRNEGGGNWSERDAWHIGDPSVRIGALDGEDAYVFGEIAGIARANDGRIWVADGQAREIRAFDANGTFLFRFGRSGEGPGEFGAIDGLLLTPDGALLARDPRRFRITRFDTAGNYVADFRLQRPYMQFGQPTWFWVDRAGEVYDRVSLTIGMGSTDSLGVIRYAPDGAVRDTLLVAEQPQTSVMIIRDGQVQAGLQIPFTPQPSVAIGPDGVIGRATGERMAFDVFDAGGSHVQTIARAVQPEPVSAGTRDSAMTAMRERASEFVPGGQLQDFTMPSTIPAVTHMLADAGGNWWLGGRGTQEYSGQPPQYHVFDPDGVYLGAVAAPLRIITIGSDWVGGVVRDEFDASYVVIVPLMKPRG